MRKDLIILFIFSIPIHLFTQETGWEEGDIAIVQWEKTSFFDSIRDSIIEGISVKVDEYHLKGKIEKIFEILRKVSKKDYRLVIMIGAQIITPILQYLPENHIIIIGSSIELDALHKKFPNITGVYSFVSPEVQYRTIIQLKNDVKNIGVIYNSLHSRIQIKMLESAITDTAISLTKNAVSNPREIATALHFMKDIDILWVPTDPIYRDKKAIESIIDFSLENKIPVLSPSIEFVQRGALASQLPKGISLEILSILASLEKGEDIADVLPRFPGERLALNINTAELLGVEIPPDLRLTSIEVYE